MKIKNQQAAVDEYYKNRPVEKFIFTVVGCLLIPMIVFLLCLIAKNQPPIPW
jgi:hypothetical protein